MKGKKERTFSNVEEVFRELFPFHPTPPYQKIIESPSVTASIIAKELLTNFKRSVSSTSSERVKSK